MSIFLSEKDILYRWNRGRYLSSMQKYLQFKWEKDHPKEEIAEVNTSNNNDVLDNSSAQKKIRIDITMDDIDEFLDFLEHREINRQKRKRYVEGVKDLYQNGWNESSTGIDNNVSSVAVRFSLACAQDNVKKNINSIINTYVLDFI